MVNRDELLSYCNELLQIESFQDYAPNGLQIEGSERISRIVTAVTASQAAIYETIRQKAQVLLVHHGYFWKHEKPVLMGMKQRRIKSLLVNDINLLAYHLPLDAHRKLGNNVLLANKLGIKTEGFASDNELLLLGQIKTQDGNQFRQNIFQVLGRAPMHVAVDRTITKVALCTGAAQGYIEAAAAQGADAFISGEISESSYHTAIENNIHYFAAGHHATERYGVQALGEHLAEHFELQQRFFDEPNPV